ncbi:UNVERIFIED_CONTAM: E3 ubiquitin-protein ligase RFI2 [Sesamum calycinum]|uniref:E3 ubiquitin-protein ligase RFI2 n=1 Tax=Sesamum calycinum TaxID=2727403 RepID=A0AAW2PQD8_9LAMI
MGLGAADLLDDGDGGGGGKASAAAAAAVSCSICLDVVMDSGDRSWAKLQCGHQFHLDCIGSAFNIKGAMQCPNCRKIEKGQWLYANGSRPLPEFSMDDWAHDEDLYDLSYSEMDPKEHDLKHCILCAVTPDTLLSLISWSIISILMIPCLSHVP